MRACERCFAIYLAALLACPSCGHMNKARAGELREVDGPQVEAIPLEQLRGRPDHRENLMRAFYRTLCGDRARKGYRAGWVGMRFKARYGFWPPRAWREDAA